MLESSCKAESKQSNVMPDERAKCHAKFTPQLSTTATNNSQNFSCPSIEVLLVAGQKLPHHG